MRQKIMLQNDSNRIQSGPIQFFDNIGELDSPGLYLRKEDAILAAECIEVIGEHLKNEQVDSVIYAVYFNKLQQISDIIRKNLK